MYNNIIFTCILYVCVCVCVYSAKINKMCLKIIILSIIRYIIIVILKHNMYSYIL